MHDFSLAFCCAGSDEASAVLAAWVDFRVRSLKRCVIAILVKLVKLVILVSALSYLSRAVRRPITRVKHRDT